MSSGGSAGAQFWRAIERQNLIVAEGLAREFEILPLDFALALVSLYGRNRDPKFEKAALRYLERFMSEMNPSLADVAAMAGLLVERRPD